MARKGKGMDKGVTLVASHTEVIGDIKFTDQLYISGKVNGNVLAEHEKATVIISEEGCVSGEVRVPNVVINGLIEGNVFASNKVELAPAAKVRGNLHYKLIEMQLGAMVDGQLVHELEPGGDNVLPLNAETPQQGES
ncbi:MAG: cell shape determination protein CcmA [Pseudomonadales bacterium]|nr:cell shape determination protein CcmA [Pseudomonadales bacterium]